LLLLALGMALAASLAPSPPRALRRPRAVLWDLDGTLCDSFRLAFGATQTVLAAHGHDPVSEAEYHACTRYATPERMARHVGVLPGDAAYEALSRTLGAEFDALYISQVRAARARARARRSRGGTVARRRAQRARATPAARPLRRRRARR
jgi:phosphoglycolate phosphatase-like HAD superfamily hydrolase